MTKLVRIGVTVGTKFNNYSRWLSTMPNVEIVKLSYGENNVSAVASCKGIMMTGGEDVHPKHYGRPEYVEKFRLDDFDEERDEFELKVLAVAHKKRLPLLGICRGMQITNVFLGGSLVPDIVAFGRDNHTRTSDEKDRQHPIWLKENTLLGEITKTMRGEVNSAHHQAVDLLGEGLSMSCVSPDGVVEAAEIRDQDNHPFMLLVQWHPERMEDQDSPFTKGILDAFVDAAAKHV